MRQSYTVIDVTVHAVCRFVFRHYTNFLLCTGLQIFSRQFSITELPIVNLIKESENIHAKKFKKK